MDIVIYSNTDCHPQQHSACSVLPTGSYSYQNADSSFTFAEELGKGMDLEVGKIQFEGWKNQNPTNPNITLYRNFAIMPGQFWDCGNTLSTAEVSLYLTNL